LRSEGLDEGFGAGDAADVAWPSLADDGLEFGEVRDLVDAVLVGEEVEGLVDDPRRPSPILSRSL
jgi:hypothetical protein